MLANWLLGKKLLQLWETDTEFSNKIFSTILILRLINTDIIPINIGYIGVIVL